MTGRDDRTDATSRRRFIAGTGALALAVAVRPSAAAPADMEKAIREATGGARLNRGRIKLSVPPLVDNGNSVPLSVAVESPMTAADHVRRIHLFNDRNPQPRIASFHIGPRAGRAAVSTRIRLADTQNVVAVAELSDGTFWTVSVEVIVTLPACVEETG